MISENLFFILLYIWMAIAVISVPFLLKITVPYGRHTTNTWGPMVNNRFGWIVMEIPVIIVFSWLFFSGDAEKTLPSYIFYGFFMLHYFNRVFIFPMQLKGKNKKMPLIIVVSAIFFNLCNGFFNGYWFGYLSPPYAMSWLFDWRFILGVLLFFTGMIINIRSDQKLISLRKGGKTGYYIPYGGMFRYVSSPNLFGEIIEWLGWAMMSWCLPAFSFALWTMTNLIPRAIDHHRWYKRRFNDYPKNRKAVIPFVV
jgi:protein-S-isoprenylcysteine O-methyltransferase Ste14